MKLPNYSVITCMYKKSNYFKITLLSFIQSKYLPTKAGIYSRLITCDHKLLIVTV